jgi:uncharacterized protein (TIGR00251 family)
LIHSTADGIVIDVRVIPRARKAGIAGTRADCLLVRVQSPPVDGAANAEVVEAIAAALGVPKSAVTIVSGERARQKRVHVAGLDKPSAESRLSTSA